MSFLNPIFLIGILSASIPFIIHLYNRKRIVTYKFAAIDFVLDSQKRIIGGSKLRQLLLLILRALLISFLAVSIAKPYINDEKYTVVVDNITPSSNVFVLDDSFSMSYNINDKPLFETAKETAIKILNNLNLMDEVSIIFCSRINSGQLEELTIDKNMVKDIIRDAKISYTSTNMIQTLEDAINILTSSNADIKRIFIFTDLTKNGWIRDEGRKMLNAKKEIAAYSDLQYESENRKIGDSVKIESENLLSSFAAPFLRLPDSIQSRIHSLRPLINIIDLSESVQLNNISITNVEINEHPDSTSGSFNIGLTINNYSPIKINKIPVRIYINNKMYAQGFVDLEPWSFVKKDFFYKPNIDGIITGRAEILENSISTNGYLDVDNIRYFIINKKEIVNALIIDGDPSANIYKNETFYLEKALAPVSEHPTYIKPFVCNLSEFEITDLNDFDLIIICNVESISNNKISELEKFAANGGAILFTAGNKIETNFYNRALRKLLPCTLRNVKSYNSIAGQDTENPSENNSTSKYSHVYLKRPEQNSIFSDIFSDLSEKDINSIDFHTIFLIDTELPSAKDQTHEVLNAYKIKGSFYKNEGSVILRYSNNLPAIVVKDYDQGQTAFFTSSIDRDWNNLPIKTVFLPIIQQICESLTSTSILEEHKSNILVNENWDLPRSFFQGLTGIKIDAAKVMKPDGNMETLFLDNSNESGKLTFTNTSQPGIFKLYKDENLTNAKELTFAVNVDAFRESNLIKIKKDQIKALFGDDVIPFVSDVKNINTFHRQDTKKNLWENVLVLVLCIVCIEAFISRR